jgi:probable F420-dependent oxidoreductase
MTDKTWADGATAREQLGRVGAWLGVLSRTPWTEARAAARRVEELGFRAIWINEGAAVKAPLAHAGLLLGATDRLAVATGIANIWVRDATAARNGAYALAEAYPGRFTLGLGVSHRPLVDSRGHNYAKPLTAMRDYLEALGAIGYRGPLPAEPVPLVLAALRDRMLELAREHTSGAHPYFTTVEHTARARKALGPDAFLGPEVAFVTDPDPDSARARARQYTASYLQLPNYTNNLRELGFADEDLEGAGSDRLVDAVVAHGDAATVADRLREHLDAGADHIAVQPVATDLAGALDELEQVAPLLRARLP